jgi:SpoVK/Ycf46/Vps4 family AAA+-type ATPase
MTHSAVVQTGSSSESRVIVIGATNRPVDLDDGVLRRLERRVYVPLPDTPTRAALLAVTLAGQATSLSEAELVRIADATAGYSGSDVASLCKEAAMRPVRELAPEELAAVDAATLRPIGARDFGKAMEVVKTSVPAAALAQYESWNAKFGMQMSSLA